MWLRGAVPLILSVIIALMISNFAGAQEEPTTNLITGTVSYPQRIALPENAEVYIELSDVSRLDAESNILATQTIYTNGRQVPLSFTLAFDPESIIAEKIYVVRAMIYVEDQLQWTTEESTPVITNGIYHAEVNVIRVPPMQEATPAGLGMAVPSFHTVTGTISLPQRMALPPNAVISVELADISLADAPAFVLASQQMIAGERQSPFAFALNVDIGSLVDNASYSVSARVTVDGELQWISDTVTPVISNDLYEADVILTQVE
jgi:putative lipoprotein